MDTGKYELNTKICQIQFICVELNLYLDTHPDDQAARADYLHYSKVLDSLTEEYESLYGPLTGFGHSPTDTGCWVNSKWPWE